MNQYKKLHSFVAENLNIILFAALAFCSLPPAHAADLNFKTEREFKNNFLAAAGEIATFQVEGDSVTGTGLKLDYGHHFVAPFQVDVSFFTAINGTDTQVSFSGLGTMLYYDLFGDCCETVTTTYLGSEKIAVEKTKVSSSFQVGLGIDQFYLNGNKNVYSSSGINAGAAYKFNLFDYNFRATMRYSMLNSNKQKIQAYFIGLGIIFSL